MQGMIIPREPGRQLPWLEALSIASGGWKSGTATLRVTNARQGPDLGEEGAHFQLCEKCSADASKAMSHPNSVLPYCGNYLRCLSPRGLRNREKLGGQERVERDKVASSRGSDFPSNKHTGAMSKHLQMIHGSQTPQYITPCP